MKLARLRLPFSAGGGMLRMRNTDPRGGGRGRRDTPVGQPAGRGDKPPGGLGGSGLAVFLWVLFI